MRIGKYVTNPGVIGAAIGAAGTAKKASSTPKDWRRLLIWGVWAAGFALAIASVAMQDRDQEYDES